MKEIIRLSHVFVKENGIDVIQDLNLSVYAGEILLLSGIHGSGKHNIVKLITGELSHTQGSIMVNGRDIPIYDFTCALKEGILYLRNKTSMSEDMTVEDNLFGLRMKDNWLAYYHSRLARRQTDFLCNQAGIPRYGGKLAFRLPLFEEHLLKIEQAATGHVKLIIIDLSDSLYTYMQILQICSLCQRLREKGITFLVISDYINEFFAVADRAIYIHAGMVSKLAFQGELTPDEQLFCMAGTAFAVEDNKLLRPPLQGESAVRIELEDKPSLQVPRGQVLGIFDLQRNYLFSDRSYLDDFIRKNQAAVFFHGCGVTDWCHSGLYGRTVVIPENSSELLLGNLSVADNLVCPDYPRVSGILGTVNDRMLRSFAANFFELTGVDPKLSVNELVKSMRKLLSIYRWKIARPQVILLENPFFSLDFLYYDVFRRMLEEITAAGVCVICSGKNPDAMFQICDTLLCCNEARLYGAIRCDDNAEFKWVIREATADADKNATS